jgi:outer membrane protein
MRSDFGVCRGLVLLACLCAPPAVAEELSLDESLELARRHSPELAARDREVAAARAQKDQARGRLLPTVEVRGQAQWVNEVEPERLEAPGLPDDNEITFGEPIDRIYFFRGSLTQPLFDGLGRIRAHQAAELGIVVERRRVEEAEADLVLRVYERYFGLYRARALTEVAEAFVRAVEAHLEQVRRLAEAGRATRLDVSHGEARLAEALVSLVEARGAERVATETFNTLLGLPGGTRVRLVDAPSQHVAAVPGKARATELALTGRPELRTARRRADLEDKRVEIEQAAWYPVVSAVAGFTLARPHERYPPPQEEFDSSWDLGLVASWSLDFGITRGRIAEARHRGAAARYRVRGLEDETSSEAQQRLAALETAEERVIAARRAEEAAEQALLQARQLFEAERLDSAQLLDREQDLTQARARALDARVERAIAAARLERLFGTRR